MKKMKILNLKRKASKKLEILLALRIKLLNYVASYKLYILAILKKN